MYHDVKIGGLFFLTFALRNNKFYFFKKEYNPEKLNINKNEVILRRASNTTGFSNVRLQIVEVVNKKNKQMSWKCGLTFFKNGVI